MQKKDAAWQFLRGLEERLLAQLPQPDQMRVQIAETVQNAKATGNRYLHEPEYAFLNKFVVPIVFSHMQLQEGCNSQAARQALLSEWYRSMPDFHADSPRRSLDHPFSKSPPTVTETMKRWRGELIGSGEKPRKPLHQACPDLAIGVPFPHSVVFEVKYFSASSGGEAALVNGIYEAFYYLAMPRTPATASHPTWDYDYGCFLAFDASSDGTLQAAWAAIPASVRTGFWRGGNLYVAILRPDQS